MTTNCKMIYEDGLPDGVTGQDLDLFILGLELDEISSAPVDPVLTEVMELIDIDDCMNAGKDYNKIVDLLDWNDCMDWEAEEELYEIKD